MKKRGYELLIVLVLLLITAAGVGTFTFSRILEQELRGYQTALHSMEQSAVDLAAEYADATKDYFNAADQWEWFEASDDMKHDLKVFRNISTDPSATIQDIDEAFFTFVRAWGLPSDWFYDELQKEEAIKMNEQMTELYHLFYQYNRIAKQYNTELEKHPFASLFGYHAVELLTLSDPAEAEVE